MTFEELARFAEQNVEAEEHRIASEIMNQLPVMIHTCTGQIVDATKNKLQMHGSSVGHKQDKIAASILYGVPMRRRDVDRDLEVIFKAARKGPGMALQSMFRDNGRVSILQGRIFSPREPGCRIIQQNSKELLLSDRDLVGQVEEFVHASLNDAALWLINQTSAQLSDNKEGELRTQAQDQEDNKLL